MLWRRGLTPWSRVPAAQAPLLPLTTAIWYIYGVGICSGALGSQQRFLSQPHSVSIVSVTVITPAGPAVYGLNTFCCECVPDVFVGFGECVFPYQSYFWLLSYISPNFFSGYFYVSHYISVASMCVWVSVCAQCFHWLWWVFVCVPILFSIGFIYSA